MGDDQNESYREDCRPAFAIYFGDTIRNGNAQHETYSHFPDWYIQNRKGFFEPQAPRDYPVHSALAVHLIEIPHGHGLRSRQLQMPAAGRRRGPCDRLCAPPGDGCPASGAGGADLLNTYFPPNQPRPRRCHAFGQAVRQAVENFPGEGRIGILASGGLSHFLVDEEFDRAILKACADKDAAFLQNLPRNKLNAGSSEILNWVAVAGAVEHLDMNWFEYVPGYRTPAGTGTGLSFATWA